MKNYWICLLAIVCLMACGGNTNTDDTKTETTPAPAPETIVEGEAMESDNATKDCGNACNTLPITLACSDCLRNNFDENRETFENFTVDGAIINGFSISYADLVSMFGVVENGKVKLNPNIESAFAMLGLGVELTRPNFTYSPRLIIEIKDNNNKISDYYNIAAVFTGTISGPETIGDCTGETGPCPEKPEDGNREITETCATCVFDKFVDDRNAFYNYEKNNTLLQGFHIAHEDLIEMLKGKGDYMRQVNINAIFSMKDGEADMVFEVETTNETAVAVAGYYDFTTPCPTVCPPDL